MTGFVAHLKQRKLVQWAIAYVAFAFALLQGVDVVAQQFGWSESVRRGITLALAVGLPVTLVLAWYHGEKGRQRVSGTELLLVALVLAAGGGLVWQFARVSSAMDSAPVAATRSRSSGAQVLPERVRVAAVPIVPVPAKSIAVLPFENLSGDADERYFSDGITEEILNALAQIPDLKVAGRASAFQFNSRDEDLREVGAALGVADVLVGSVQKAGDEVRINVRLVDARTGYQRWSEKYDRKLTNIFAIEDDISRAIAGALRVEFTGAGGLPLLSKAAVDQRAHDFFLRGLTLFAARGSGVEDAVADFGRAVAIAPHYAEAWGMLAEAEAQLPFYEPRTLAAALAKAESAAQRALSLDPDTASAYVARGVVRSLRWQWTTADADFSHALSLAPNDAEVADQRAQFLFNVGQLKPAMAEIDRARTLDPLSSVVGIMRAAILTALHRFDEADTQLAITLKLHPDSVYAHFRAMALAVARRNYQQAQAEIRRTAQLDGDNPDAAALLIRGIADRSQRAAAVAALVHSPFNGYLRGDPLMTAMFLVWLGETDHALRLLQRDAIERNSIQPKLLWEPAFDPVRSDARFKAVLTEMRLPYAPARPSAS